MTISIPPEVNLICEDAPQEAIMIKILQTCSLTPGITFGLEGNGFIRTNIRGINQSAVFNRYFALTDLDDYVCPMRLIEEWLGRSETHPNLVFRVVIRQIESWLMADRTHFEEYFNIPQGIIPLNVDEIRYPKQYLLNLIKTRSRNGDLKRQLLPTGTTAVIGRQYNRHMLKYVNDYWDINIAKTYSPSLNRAIARVQLFNSTLSNQNPEVATPIQTQKS